MKRKVQQSKGHERRRRGGGGRGVVHGLCHRRRGGLEKGKESHEELKARQNSREEILMTSFCSFRDLRRTSKLMELIIVPGHKAKNRLS